MELTIVVDGYTLKGSPCYYLDPPEDAEPRVNCYGVEIEDDAHFSSGFFHSEEEAREWAKERGHTVGD